MSRPALTKNGIKNFLNKPTWSVKTLLENSAGFEPASIDEAVVKKMLRLSGLNTPESSDGMTRIKKALEAQMVFINHLYDKNSIGNGENTNNTHFRLLPNDHRNQEPLDLLLIQQSIAKLQPDQEKGEGNFTIKDMRESNFFVVKAKL